jgi:thiamine transport system permease protein
METGKHISPHRPALPSTGVPVYLSTFSRPLLWLVPLAFLIIAFFYPLARILALTLDPQALTTQNLLLSSNVLLFTFYQAALSTFLTLLLGLPSAYLFARYDFRGKSILRALTAVPFMLPTVVVAAGFSALLGPRGLVHSLFPLSSFNFIGTLTAILIAHVF